MSGEACFRLDSSHPHEARWALPPTWASMVLRHEGAVTTLRRRSDVLRQWEDPLAALQWMAEESLNCSEHAAPRWVGYLSYDLGRLFEQLPTRALDDLCLPLFVFGLVESGDQPPSQFDESENKFCGDIEELRFSSLRSTFTPEQYQTAVARVIEYIRSGDVYQVNLSQRLTTALRQPVADIYGRLLRDAPAWYGGLLDFGDHALLCNSPELFLRVVPDPQAGRRRIITRPIKGTRPRAAGMAAALRDSGKDQAELNMIVDLERNDLGRVCEIGSVKVTQPRTIETHPTVYHGAATIEGLLRRDAGFVDVLRAMFPGGSVTGAPKIRAMQIIEELEPVRRGPYCGAIGYVGRNGQAQFNLAIRTMIVKDQWIHIPVGGGIVADSDPADEYAETLVKARAMLAALGIAR